MFVNDLGSAHDNEAAGVSDFARHALPPERPDILRCDADSVQGVGNDSEVLAILVLEHQDMFPWVLHIAINTLTHRAMYARDKPGRRDAIAASRSLANGSAFDEKAGQCSSSDDGKHQRLKGMLGCNWTIAFRAPLC